MGPAAFIIAIMGCGEGDAPCRELRVLDTVHASEANCVRSTEAAMLAFSGADYPVIVAQCRSADARPALAPAEIRLPAPAAPRRATVSPGRPRAV